MRDELFASAAFAKLLSKVGGLALCVKAEHEGRMHACWFTLVACAMHCICN